MADLTFGAAEFIKIKNPAQDCAKKEKVMEDTQMAMSVAVTKESLDFQATMSSAIINGSFEKAAELQANLARSAGLAAEGIGGNVNIAV